jgi:hypothetical protein
VSYPEAIKKYKNKKKKSKKLYLPVLGILLFA